MGHLCGWRRGCAEGGCPVVKRAITASKDVSQAADEFFKELTWEEIDPFTAMTDF